MRRPVIRSLLAGAALVVSGIAATPALAGTDVTPATADGVRASEVVHQELATTRAQQRAAEAYWTPERMRSAIPADATLPGDASTASATAQDIAPAAVPENPRPQLGKVFFTIGGVNYVCSGTATNSGNGDVVTTAGHCLHEGGGGSFASAFTFVPAYNNGSAPYGQWSASDLYTTSGWANSGDFNVDAGFAVMNENSSGQSLTSVVGSYPIAFNLSRGLTYTSYGYPAGPPFNGQTLYSCTGAARLDPGGQTTQGITCDMTGGSSGGGWITGGQLNSVNSYKYTNDPNTMYGPYFGSTIQSVYNAAAAA
ncbi:V8-like Glu-specific endopeptidase [Jiangella alkaliphila]|uniref:V8-like Glu-specific endopeptidase n=1 Tax=Jiangella alkaliphila TaxID=419479 RepID=A0A1H2JUL8_9ACTN|nr:V8-like Glu-specific endopeptidase [Jiangella alkaliphila]